MTFVARVADGLQSLATRLGTSSDKAATASYAINVLDDQQLEAAFRTSWVARKVVTIPAMDATRKWRQWSGDKAEDIEALEDDRAIGLKTKVAEAHWKARLYGGAAILIGTPDENWTEPLDAAGIGPGDLRYLAVLTRQDLTAGLLEDDPRQPRFGKPRHYDIITTSSANQGLFRIHPSRLVEFRGDPLPRWNTGGIGVYGWGDSVLQAAYEACRNLDATMANIASLVFDAKTDVIRIPGLTENITDAQFEQALIQRFTTARMLKGNNGTLILDAEEQYDSKAYSFGGLDAIADRFMQIAAGAADIPMTRLLGMSPGGLNSTGEGDLANYYDKVASIQSTELEPALAILDEVIARAAGADWETHNYEWRPLRQMTEEQISEMRSRDAQTVANLAGSRVYPDDAVAEVGAQMFAETGIDALTGQVAMIEEGPEEAVEEVVEE